MNKSCHIVRCKSICCVTKNADGVLDHFYEIPWFSPILGNVNICTQVLHKNLFQWSVKPALSSITNPAPLLAGPALQKCWQLILSENERDLFPSQGRFWQKVTIFLRFKQCSFVLKISWQFLREHQDEWEDLFVITEDHSFEKWKESNTILWMKESDKDSFANLVR